MGNLSAVDQVAEFGRFPQTALNCPRTIARTKSPAIFTGKIAPGDLLANIAGKLPRDNAIELQCDSSSMTLTFTQGHWVMGKLDHLQSFYWKVSWSNPNVQDGWSCKGDDQKEVLQFGKNRSEHKLCSSSPSPHFSINLDEIKYAAMTCFLKLAPTWFTMIDIQGMDPYVILCWPFRDKTDFFWSWFNCSHSKSDNCLKDLGHQTAVDLLSCKLPHPQELTTLHLGIKV